MMINMTRGDRDRPVLHFVAVRSSHGMTLVLDDDATSALANLLANLDHVTTVTPPNYMEHLIELRKEAFGY